MNNRSMTDKLIRLLLQLNQGGGFVMKKWFIFVIPFLFMFAVGCGSTPNAIIQEAYLMRKPSDKTTLVRIKIKYAGGNPITSEGIRYKSTPSQTALLTDDKGKQYKPIKTEIIGSTGLDGEFLANEVLPRFSEGILIFPLIDKNVKKITLTISDISGVSVYGQNITPFSLYYEWDFSNQPIPETTWILNGLALVL